MVIITEFHVGQTSCRGTVRPTGDGVLRGAAGALPGDRLPVALGRGPRVERLERVRGALGPVVAGDRVVRRAEDARGGVAPAQRGGKRARAE